MYYLQSRYYDPALKRFINADGFVSTGRGFLGYNMFVYCNNNPINNVDFNGYLADWVYKYFGNEWNYYQYLRYGLTWPGDSANTAATTGNSNRRPYTGEPGSTYRAPNGDTRTYGPDGTPAHDYDHSDHGFPDKHPHDENGGHNHDWVNGKRGPAYSIGWEQVFGVVLVGGCIIGTIVVAGNDVTGVGAADDFLLGPLYAGIEKGLSLIMG